MLRSLNVMLHYHVVAVDGEIGRVQDFLFDDESWIVQYMVVEIGNLRSSRKVLIIPFALGFPGWESKRISVRLTREQIRNCPPLESDMPISVQRASGIKLPGTHLRSMREVFGYTLRSTDGEIGTIEDFIVEDTLWGVRHVVVALTSVSGRSILTIPEAIRSFSWQAKEARVDLSLQEAVKRPDFDPAKPVNLDDEHRFYDYYGRPVLSSRPVQSERKVKSQVR